MRHMVLGCCLVLFGVPAFAQPASQPAPPGKAVAVFVFAHDAPTPDEQKDLADSVTDFQARIKEGRFPLMAQADNRESAEVVVEILKRSSSGSRLMNTISMTIDCAVSTRDGRKASLTGQGITWRQARSDALDNLDSWVRRNYAAIKGVAEPAAAKATDVQLQIETLKNDRDDIRRAEAARRLGQLGPAAVDAAPLLVAMLGNMAPLTAPAKGGGRVSTTPGYEAGMALLKINGPDLLLKALREEKSGNARWTAAKCLCEVPADVAVPALAAAGRTDPDWSVREGIARFLAKIPGAASVDALIAMLADTKKDVRKSVAASLATLTGESFGDDRPAWERWRATAKLR